MSVPTGPVDFDPFAGGELEATAPSTEEQEEIWTAVEIGGDSANLAYNESVTLRLRGPVDEGALERAVAALLRRHEALRATFSPGGDTLCIAPDPGVRLVREDLSRLEPEARSRAAVELRRREVSTPFDLVRGPLVRFVLVKLREEEHELVVSAHHIVCDGWSTGIVLLELSSLYTEAVTGKPAELPEPSRFTEYAASERRAAGTREIAENEAYWISQYQGDVPLLDLPTDRPRPAERTFEAAREDWKLPPELVRGLRDVGKKAGASFVATLLAAFEVFVSRIAGQRSFALGMPAAGQAVAGTHCLVGHAVYTLPIRADVDPEASFLDHLRRVKAHLLDAFDHQRFTFGTLLKRLSIPRDPSRVPLIPVLFNLDRGVEGLAFAGLDVDYVVNPRVSESFEMFVNATQFGDELVLETTYNTSLWDRATVVSRLEELTVLLRGVVDAPATKVGDLPILSDRDRAWLDGWNRTERALPEEGTLAALFEAQVKRTPRSPAVVSGDGALTYEELDGRANQLARRLQALGVRAGDRVGISLERTPELVVAVLGASKAGATYVPLDPDFPAARLAFIAEDARLAALVTQRSIIGSLPRTTAQPILIDGDRAALDAESREAPPRSDLASSIAYVLHTSGSTGKPKGVEVPHGAVVNFLSSMAREPGLGPSDVLVAVTTLSFDIAVLELFLPLVVGAKVAIVPREVAMDGHRLAEAIRRLGATAMQATPSTWRLLLEASVQFPPGFKALVGGEAFPRDLAAELSRRVSSLWNMYGPTETTIWSTCHEVTKTHGAIPIGKPIANTVVYALDDRRNRVPKGVPGELYIGGAGVARGYLNRPDLTAERFVESPFIPGHRLYRTGDVVRFTDDGLVFERRVDGQVKVRGYRIELGEIEAVVADHRGVRECVALVREDRPGDQRIVLYAAVDPAEKVTAESLRKRAEAALPGYMVPAHFVLSDGLPMTPNGKIDRKALPAPGGARDVEAEHVTPRTEVERKIAQIWEELLGAPRVGARDDFFALGGHSMLATRMLSRVRDAFGVDVGLRRVFRSPTVSGLSEHIEAALLLQKRARPESGPADVEEVVL